MKPTDRRHANPIERLRANAVQYADMVIAVLEDEWLVGDEALHSARCVPYSRVRRLLYRSGADALIYLIIAKLIRDGWVRAENQVIYFEPKLIKRFEAAAHKLAARKAEPGQR